MYELTYQSDAAQDLTTEEINSILEVARRCNAEHNITGCLIFFNNSFIQIIEGEEEDIKQLFSNLQKDERHKNIKIIFEGQIEERMFSEWGMAYHLVNDENNTEKELHLFKQNWGFLAENSFSTNTSSVLFWKMVKMLLVK